MGPRAGTDAVGGKKTLTTTGDRNEIPQLFSP